MSGILKKENARKKPKGIAPLCEACTEPLMYVKYRTKTFSIGSRKPVDKYTVYVDNQRNTEIPKCDKCGSELSKENIVWFMERIHLEDFET